MISSGTLEDDGGEVEDAADAALNEGVGHFLRGGGADGEDGASWPGC